MAKQRTMAEIRRILNVSPSNYRIEIHHEDTVLSLLALAAKNNSDMFWEANGTLEKALPLPHHLKKYLNQICARVEGGSK